MHASDTHRKAQLALQRAKQLIASNDEFLRKARETYDRIEEENNAQERAVRGAQKQLDEDIVREMNAVDTSAEEYLSSFDS